MFALEAGGADIIELGMPFSDPIGDGPTIQRSNTVCFFSLHSSLFPLSTIPAHSFVFLSFSHSLFRLVYCNEIIRRRS